MALTDSLSGAPASLPPELVRLRAEALRRTGRDAEARDLLIRLAKGDTADRRTDPETLYELADLLAGQGKFDTAMKLVAKADSQLPFEAERRPAARSSRWRSAWRPRSEVYHSPHFDVRYPPLRGEEFARDAAKHPGGRAPAPAGLDPLASARVTEVHLLPFDDFRLGYSPGMDILGLYDGKIRVPLGDAPEVQSLRRQHPHPRAGPRDDRRADGATGRRAGSRRGWRSTSRWWTTTSTPSPAIATRGTCASFPLIEPAIGSYSPALVAIGYDESRWTLHYVEHRYGQAGIQRMLNAFRAGKTTDEAIAGASASPSPLQPGASGTGAPPRRRGSGRCRSCGTTRRRKPAVPIRPIGRNPTDRADNEALKTKSPRPEGRGLGVRRPQDLRRSGGGAAGTGRRRQPQAEGEQADFRRGSGVGEGAGDHEAVGSPAGGGARVVGERGGLVGAVAVGVVGDRALVGDRRAGGAGVDRGGDGDRHEPPAGIAPFQVTVLVPAVGDGRAAGGGGADQGQPAGRTSVNSLPGLSR